MGREQRSALYLLGLLKNCAIEQPLAGRVCIDKKLVQPAFMHDVFLKVSHMDLDQ